MTKNVLFKTSFQLCFSWDQNFIKENNTFITTSYWFLNYIANCGKWLHSTIQCVFLKHALRLATCSSGGKAPFPWSMSSLNDLLIHENRHDELTGHVRKGPWSFWSSLIEYFVSEPSSHAGRSPSHMDSALCIQLTVLNETISELFYPRWGLWWSLSSNCLS